MIAQKRKLIEYKQEKENNKITNYAGTLPILELANRIGLFEYADRQINIRSNGQGWLDSQYFLTILLLNFLGFKHVSDVNILEKDSGLTEIMKKKRKKLLKYKNIEKRFRKKVERIFPSDKAIHNYLSSYHNEEEEKRREKFYKKGVAFIPKENENLKKLNGLYKLLLEFSQRNKPVSRVTLDLDATIKESNKRSAKETYKPGVKGYQPLNGYWVEKQMVVLSEFRDGNVPAGYKIDEFCRKAFSNIPRNTGKRYLRSDAAGYNWNLMEYCEEEGIEFSISCPIYRGIKEKIIEVKEAEWNKMKNPIPKILRDKKIEGEWEWVELDYISDNPLSDEFRYIAYRNIIPRDRYLFGKEEEKYEEEEEEDNSVKQYKKDGKRYRVRVIVTNRRYITGEELFYWHNKRCGYSEQVHDIMKNELSGGSFPSDKFGANAFWWHMMIFSLNILQIYKGLVLENGWLTRRIKTLRLYFIYLAGRVVSRGRRLFVYVRDKEKFDKITEKIYLLKLIPI